MNTIKIQSRNLTFDGSASTAMDFVDDVRNAYDEAGNDMPKLLNDFMNTMTPCPKDSPLMREWENYNQSDEYANSFKWAAHEEHRKGSMWAAFMAGFLAAKPMTHAEDGENNEGDLKREHDRLEEELEDVSKERDQLRYTLCNFLGISIMEPYDAIITQAKEATK